MEGSTAVVPWHPDGNVPAGDCVFDQSKGTQARSFKITNHYRFQQSNI